MKDLGGAITSKFSVAPQADDGSSAINGTGVDRRNYRYATAIVMTGATTGSPTSFTTTGKLQESSDDSTYTDISGATVSLTAANKLGEINVALSDKARYIRLVISTDFTGGSSPTVQVAGAIILGGAKELPV